MTGYDEMEMYLRKVLSNSISSANPSKEAKQKARKLSPSYFEDYKQRLLNEWSGKNVEDIDNSEVISTSFGDTLRITHEEKIDFKKTYLGLFKSRPFVMIAISGVLISGQLQFNSFNAYLYKNYFTDTSLSVLGTICTYLPMAALILFTPKLAARFGKKELCGRMSIISAVTSVFLAITANNQDFIMWINPQQGIYPAWLFMACLLLIGFGYTFVSLTCWAVVMDVIDYQEYTTGVRNESAVYSAYTFGRQLGQAIADAGGLFLLQWAKYDSETAGNGFIAANDTSNKIMFICTIIPAIVYTGVWLLMRFGYPLTKEKLEHIYAHVRAKREEAAKEA